MNAQAVAHEGATQQNPTECYIATLVQKKVLAHKTAALIDTNVALPLAWKKAAAQEGTATVSMLHEAYHSIFQVSALYDTVCCAQVVLHFAS